MYAIVETGGKQYRVKPGDTVAVEKLAGEPGEMLDLDRVLLIAGNTESETWVGSPGVAGAVVRAEVLAHFRGNKIIIFRYKSKVRYRRKTGHRQSLTRLRITDILVDGASSIRAEEPVVITPPEGETVADVAVPDVARAEPEDAPASGHDATEPVATTTPQGEEVGKPAAWDVASSEPHEPAGKAEALPAETPEAHEA